MCGIAGILNLDGTPASPVVLRAMTDAIAHRGPDGEGGFSDGRGMILSVGGGVSPGMPRENVKAMRDALDEFNARLVPAAQ